MKAYKVISQDHPSATIHAETIQGAWVEYLEGHEGAVVTAIFEERVKDTLNTRKSLEIR